MTTRRAPAWRELRPFLPLTAIVVVYLVLRTELGSVVGGDGLLMPSCPVETGRILLGVATRGMRLLSLFVVPLVAAYRLVMRAVASVP